MVHSCGVIAINNVHGATERVLRAFVVSGEGGGMERKGKKTHEIKPEENLRDLDRI